MALALTADFTPFSAEHQYFPDWVLLVLKLSVSPSAIVIPSLVHVIFGDGFPAAAHWKVSNFPSVTILSSGLRIILGESNNVKREV